MIAIRTTGARLLWAALVVVHGKGGVFLLIPAQVFRVGDLLVRYSHPWWIRHTSLWWHRQRRGPRGGTDRTLAYQTLPLLNRAMPSLKVLCYCKQCEGQKIRAQKTIKKHLELYGLAQSLGDDGGGTDWGVLSEDHEDDIASVSSESVPCLVDAREPLPGTADLDEYEDFEPITFEGAEDNADRIPNHHRGYVEWQEVIEPGDDAEWFNFPHELDTSINEDTLSDQEDDAHELDNMIQWLRDEYDVELMRDGAHLNHPCEANTF